MEVNMCIWKSIQGYDGYEISNTGVVRSFKRKSIKNLKPLKLPTGYLCVDLCKDTPVVTKPHLIHRLVAIHFLDNPYNKTQVNHIDGDKSNNNVNNLEWCTAKENMHHSFKSGLNRLTGTIGASNGRSKLNDDIVRSILNDPNGPSHISRKYSISPSTVCDIRAGRSWTHITKLNKVRKCKFKQ